MASALGYFALQVRLGSQERFAPVVPKKDAATT
jgi:hypothetical protein